MATADEDPPRDDMPTVVRAKLAGITARLNARFDIAIDRGAHQDARTLALPAGASVTAARVTVNGHSRQLDLVNASDASDRFEATRSGAPSARRAWTFIVRADHAGMLALDTAAPRDAKVTLDLELDAPTCFVHDTRHVSVPESWFDALAPALEKAEIADPDLLQAACGESEGVWFGLAKQANRAPTAEGRIATSAGRLSLSAHDIARAEIDLARELADIPSDLRTAIVVDSSRSLSADELDEQRAIVAAYLAIAPHGSVQLIAYARRAEPLLAGWMATRAAAPAIDRVLRSLTARNGSNVDAGLAMAATWLAKTTGTKRVLVFSDERLALRVSDHVAALSAIVPSGTIVHTIALGGGEGELVRDDGTTLAPLAVATTGISVDGAVGADGHVDATVLARPIALDHFTLMTSRWEKADSIASTCEADSSLAEGMSCTWWGVGGASSGELTVDGLLWNKPFKRVLRPDRSQGLAMARVLAALGGFEEDLQRDIDEAALAVNSVWSLYGSWGGTGGYGDQEGGGGTGWGSICGCDGFGTIGHGSGTGSGRQETSELRDQLAGAVSGCHPDSARVEVTVETTLDEIADVEVSVVPASAAVRDCITEGVWNVQLHLRSPRPYDKTTLAYIY